MTPVDKLLACISPSCEAEQKTAKARKGFVSIGGVALIPNVEELICSFGTLQDQRSVAESLKQLKHIAARAHATQAVTKLNEFFVPVIKALIAAKEQTRFSADAPRYDQAAEDINKILAKLKSDLSGDHLRFGFIEPRLTSARNELVDYIATNFKITELVTISGVLTYSLFYIPVESDPLPCLYHLFDGFHERAVLAQRFKKLAEKIKLNKDQLMPQKNEEYVKEIEEYVKDCLKAGVTDFAVSVVPICESIPRSKVYPQKAFPQKAFDENLAEEIFEHCLKGSVADFKLALSSIANVTDRDTLLRSLFIFSLLGKKGQEKLQIDHVDEKIDLLFNLISSIDNEHKLMYISYIKHLILFALKQDRFQKAKSFAIHAVQWIKKGHFVESNILEVARQAVDFEILHIVPYLIRVGLIRYAHQLVEEVSQRTTKFYRGSEFDLAGYYLSTGEIPLMLEWTDKHLEWADTTKYTDDTRSYIREKSRHRVQEFLTDVIKKLINRRDPDGAREVFNYACEKDLIPVSNRESMDQEITTLKRSLIT